MVLALLHAWFGNLDVMVPIWSEISYGCGELWSTVCMWSQVRGPVLVDVCCSSSGSFSSKSQIWCYSHYVHLYLLRLYNVYIVYCILVFVIFLGGVFITEMCSAVLRCGTSYMNRVLYVTLRNKVHVFMCLSMLSLSSDCGLPCLHFSWFCFSCLFAALDAEGMCPHSLLILYSKILLNHLGEPFVDSSRSPSWSLRNVSGSGPGCCGMATNASISS